MIKSLPGSTAPPLRLSNRRWTYDDLREMPESMERMEIVYGDLYMSPSPNVVLHQNAVGNLFAIMRQWVRKEGWGKAFVSPADVTLSPDHVVQPDVFAVAADRLKMVGKYVAGIPDIIVEVVSPSSMEYDRITKYALYEAYGVKEYWLVDAAARSVEVFVLRGGRYELLGIFGRGADARSEVLAGFTAEVDEISA